MPFDPGPKRNLPEQEPKNGKGPYPLLIFRCLAPLFICIVLAPMAHAARIQDSPDGFPTDGRECQGLQYWRWTPRGPILVCTNSGRLTDDSDPWRSREEEQTSVEVLTLDPPESEPVFFPSQFCTDSDDECKAALTKGCQDHMRTVLPIAFDAYTYNRSERTCSGTCPDGTRIKCEVQPITPLPKPRDPNEV